jgi:hypothetical protein
MNIRRKLVLAAVVVITGLGVAVYTRGSSEPTSSVAAAEAPSPAPRRVQDRIAHHRAQLADLAGRPHAAEALRSAWDGTTDRAERMRILEAATKVPDRTGLDMLVVIARTDDALGAQAAAAIGKLMHPGLAGELVRLAASDSSVLVRSNAARALARIGSHEEAPVLAGIVADASAPMRVRQEAALALARIGDDAAAAVLGGTLDELAAHAEAEQLRIAIVQALGGITATAAGDALVRHQGRRLSATEQAFVVRALAHRQHT